MLLELTDFKTGKHVLVNIAHVSCIKHYEEAATENGVTIIGSKVKPKIGSMIIFVLNGGQAIVKETLDEIADYVDNKSKAK